MCRSNIKLKFLLFYLLYVENTIFYCNNWILCLHGPRQNLDLKMGSKEKKDLEPLLKSVILISFQIPLFFTFLINVRAKKHITDFNLQFYLKLSSHSSYTWVLVIFTKNTYTQISWWNKFFALHNKYKQLQFTQK